RRLARAGGEVGGRGKVGWGEALARRRRRTGRVPEDEPELTVGAGLAAVAGREQRPLASNESLAEICPPRHASKRLPPPLDRRDRSARTGRSRRPVSCRAVVESSGVAMTDVAHASPAPAQKPLLRPPRRLRSPQQRPEPSVVA